MSIKVGIQEGIKFSSVELDEKNQVVFSFTQGKEVDAMQALMGNGNFGGAESSKVIMWALKGTGYQEASIEGKQIPEHINQYKSFFNEILRHFFKEEDINWTSIFEGVSNNVENFTASEIEKVGVNINKIFVDLMKKADSTKEFRIKFYRSSPAKNFVTLKHDMFMKFKKVAEADGFRKSWTVPFMEPMAILSSQTKLSYSDYEKSKGWDNAAAVQADTMPASGSDDLPFVI